MKPKKVKGTFDLLPNHLTEDRWLSSSIWQEIDHRIHSIAALWGYSEIRPPILEYLELFEKSSGETSDICMKEMYRLKDLGNRDLVLRPEGTPSALRALGEAGCFSHGENFRKRHDVYYLGPMFRYERPQSGRYRQFVQFGVESIGQDSASVDCQTISIGAHILKNLSIPYTIAINFLGSPEELKEYKSIVIKYFESCHDKLSEDSKRRLISNPLRILDSKDPLDQEWIKKAPQILETLGTKSKERFAEIKCFLTKLNINHFVSPFLVRGLDYYTDIVFEFLYDRDKSLPSLGGGGRYNTLIGSMGYQDLPGCGLAFGMERLVRTAIVENGIKIKAKKAVFFITLLKEHDATCEYLTWELRKHNIPVITRFAEKQLGKVLGEANTMQLNWALIYGTEEQSKQIIQLKNLEEQTTTNIPLTEVVTYLQNKICK